MSLRRMASLLVAAATVTACSGVKSTTITEANKDQIIAKVAQSNLTPEEKTHFASFMAALR